MFPTTCRLRRCGWSTPQDRCFMVRVHTTIHSAESVKALRRSFDRGGSFDREGSFDHGGISIVEVFRSLRCFDPGGVSIVDTSGGEIGDVQTFLSPPLSQKTDGSSQQPCATVVSRSQHATHQQRQQPCGDGRVAQQQQHHSDGQGWKQQCQWRTPEPEPKP